MPLPLQSQSTTAQHVPGVAQNRGHWDSSIRASSHQLSGDHLMADIMSGQAETAISRPLLARNTGSGETAKKRGTFAPALTYCACIILLHISIGVMDSSACCVRNLARVLELLIHAPESKGTRQHRHGQITPLKTHYASMLYYPTI